MLNWLRSLAAALMIERPDEMPAIDADFRDGAEPCESGVPAPAAIRLEELERLLREPSRGL